MSFIFKKCPKKSYYSSIKIHHIWYRPQWDFKSCSTNILDDTIVHIV